MNNISVFFLGGGVVPVPPGDEPDGTEEYIFRLSHQVARLGIDTTVIDVRAGAYQKEARKTSAAKFKLLRRLPFTHWYRHAFLQKPIGYCLIMAHTIFFAWSAGFSLLSLLARRHTRLVHSNFSEPTIAAAMANRLTGKRARIIYDTHSPILMADLSLARKLINYSEILAVRWADHVIVDTPSVKRRLVSAYGINADKITPLIQHGSFDEEEVAAFLARQGSSKRQTGKLVLNVSKVHPTKNQLAVVKAARKVLELQPDARFVFAGAVLELAYQAEIDTYIKENDLSRAVEFRGEVTREELFELYGSATVFVFPSLMESQGVVVIEAATFGVPVIASDIEPVRDVAALSPGTIAVLPMDDTERLAAEIAGLLGDPARREKLAARSRELAMTLSWGNMAQRTAEIYRKILAGC